MKIFYSAEHNGFFSDAIVYNPTPVDLVEVSQEVHEEFMLGRDGKIMQPGADGLPSWADTPPLSQEQLIQIAETERQRLLAKADAVMLDWRTELMLGEISDANRAKLSAWMAYKNEIKAVDVTTDPEHVNWPVPPEA
ncbi:tail fiber assembly protein [Citrobacter sp. wls716]|uniref:tail fiber assembly protein n=1 Tax=Citrobacter sp. wls716 TaxID=2576420 RepID=UPI0010C9B852|nr:tail fiber assembly protein [Citrobacter sp. wls716]TKU39723.1 tail fiber assembly protein [Citrobacter sp. wls716]